MSACGGSKPLLSWLQASSAPLGLGRGLVLSVGILCLHVQTLPVENISPWMFSLSLIYCLKIAASILGYCVLPISYQPSAGKDLRKMDRMGFYVALLRNNC